MAVKKITRKVISKVVTAPAKTEKVSGEVNGETQKETRPKKVCFFCHSKTSPIYTDIAVLRKYVTDRAKIVARVKTAVCSRHQRAVTRHIKYARHLSMLPFVPKV